MRSDKPTKPSGVPQGAKRPDTKLSIESYPHPSFPGPDGPSIEKVTRAKQRLAALIRQSKGYSKAIKAITIRPDNRERYVLYLVDKYGTPMLDETISCYSLLLHEMVWDELLQNVYNELGNVGAAKGMLQIMSTGEQISVAMQWNV